MKVFGHAEHEFPVDGHGVMIKVTSAQAVNVNPALLLKEIFPTRG